MRPGCRSRWWGVGHGIAPNQLFRWRRLYAEGALSAMYAGEEAIRLLWVFDAIPIRADRRFGNAVIGRAREGQHKCLRHRLLKDCADASGILLPGLDQQFVMQRDNKVVDAEDARQRGDHAPRLVPEQMIAGLHYMFICWTGRTSTEPPTSKIGQPLDISTACARSVASIRLKPPTTSLASA